MYRLGWIVLTSLLSLPAASAWDYPGHRAVNELALGALPRSFPDFVRAPAPRERILFLSGEPDRWRNAPDLALRHANGPDHFLDLEDLEPAGLALERLPRFRYEVVAAAADVRRGARAAAPGPADTDHTRWLPGLLPWALAEHYARLRSAFGYLAAYEALGTRAEVENARANVVALMGTMGHYAGDAAQPLHTTRHYNRWVGDNPRAFTTGRGFHQWIDGGFLEAHGVDPNRLARRVRAARGLAAREGYVAPDDIVGLLGAFLRESHAQVVPLYELEREGKLGTDPVRARAGRDLLEAQLVRGAELLADLWLTAWRTAPEDTYLLRVLGKRAGLPARRARP